ncbi:MULTISPECIES: amino acid permease [unclassified Embleya]|uniref:amino acid permease n=1 Tax=unclassified Embleya TaxID=2699296 RepID=UPI0033DAB837
MANALFRTKNIEQSIQDTDVTEGHGLRRELSALDLMVFGVGVVVGTGIFVLTGTAAKDYAGPAVALSFVLAGFVCGLAALCYAEFASTVPVAGSAYTFSYTTLGELPAWIIGWDLILELALGVGVVSIGWSGYLTSLLSQANIDLPQAITAAPGDGGKVNLPALLLVLGVATILVFGVKLSARFNLVMVTIKIAIVLLVIFAGLFFVKTGNYNPFVPDSQPPSSGNDGLKAPLVQTLFGFEPQIYGVMGIFSGAALVFFAYIGFDVVATAAEETRKPQRDMPIGILGSLVICTILYVSVSLVVVGMQRYDMLSSSAPLAEAFRSVGKGWIATIISIGAVAGLTTVCMILMMGQSRVFFAMSRDGLLPPLFAKVHPRFGTPYMSTMLIAVVVAAIAGFTPIHEIDVMVNIGTLFAFMVVAASVLILRRTRPELPRAFRVPLVPWLPILSMLATLWLMLNLSTETWLRFLVWMVAGFVVYFLYGRQHSRLR